MNTKRIYKTLVHRCDKLDKKSDKTNQKSNTQKAVTVEDRSNKAVEDVEIMISSLSDKELEELKVSLENDVASLTGKNKKIAEKGLAYIDYFKSTMLTASHNEAYNQSWQQAKIDLPKTDWFHYLHEDDFNDTQKKYIREYLITTEVNLFTEDMRSKYNTLTPINFFSSVPNLQYLNSKICGPLTQDENSFSENLDAENRVHNANGDICDDIVFSYDKAANDRLIANNKEAQEFHTFLLKIFGDMRNKKFKGCIQSYEYKNIQRYVEKAIANSNEVLKRTQMNIKELEEDNKYLEENEEDGLSIF